MKNCLAFHMEQVNRAAKAEWTQNELKLFEAIDKTRHRLSAAQLIVWIEKNCSPAPKHSHCIGKEEAKTTRKLKNSRARSIPPVKRICSNGKIVSIAVFCSPLFPHRDERLYKFVSLHCKYRKYAIRQRRKNIHQSQSPSSNGANGIDITEKCDSYLDTKPYIDCNKQHRKCDRVELCKLANAKRSRWIRE